MIDINQITFNAAFNSGPLHPAYVNDLEEIVMLYDEMGIHMTRWQAQEVWESYSSTRDAQWLGLPKDAMHRVLEIRTAISEFIRLRLV